MSRFNGHGARRGGRRARRGEVFRVEALESRTLLAATVFAGPSLTNLLQQALRGRSTPGAVSHTMLAALQSQLGGDPLAELNSGVVDGNGFVREVQTLEAGYEQSINQQLLPRFTSLDEMLKLQGQRIVADVTALNQQCTAGLITRGELAVQARTAINTLTVGPISSQGTPLRAFVTRTQAFANDLNTLTQEMGSTSAQAPSVSLLGATLLAEAEAYRADLHVGLQLTNPRICQTVDAAINTLERAEGTLDQASHSTATTQLATAVAAFDQTMLGTKGLFGSRGLLARAGLNDQSISIYALRRRTTTTIVDVSGGANLGGTATLTARLASTTGAGIAGQTVSFVVGGAFAGIAVTDSKGVATLAGVPTTAPAGQSTDFIYTSFAGAFTAKSSSNPGTGDLTVAKAATSLSSVAGTGTFGGTATLTARLTSLVTGLGVSGQPVNFTLDGQPVGAAVTDSGGVATLQNIVTNHGAGTVKGAVAANYGGSSSYFAATQTAGDLAISHAATSLGKVVSTAKDGTATLTATLASSVTGHGVPGAVVSFTLDGKLAGTTTTDAQGVATLTGVPTNDPVGTYHDAVVASFSGNANYAAASDALSDLVVYTVATAITHVSGTADFGGTSALTATLTSAVTGLGIAGEPVQFTLDGTTVGTAVTDSNGVATVSGVKTSDLAGLHSGAVTVQFAGDGNYAASTGNGNLMVSQATTTLSSVAGTSVYGGPATLTAALTSTVTGQAIAGEVVQFTLDGTTVGTAVTDSNGVATVTGVTTSDLAGTYPGVVAVQFAGDGNYVSSSGSGNLVVTQATTTLSSVSGTSVYGGTATLTATLTSAVTGLGIAGESVQFTLDGTTVGSAVTDSNGVATVTGVATSDLAGTYPGTVIVQFTGDGNYVSSSGSGNLVVNRAPTALSDVSGGAIFGSTATLTATLKSTVTGQAIADEPVRFTLDGTTVGTAVTDSNGVATVTGVATSSLAGVHPGVVIVQFAGDSNFAAGSGTGAIIVNQAPTILSSVSGTSVYGGTATLTATLTSVLTGQGIVGESVQFTLDGATVVSAVTDSNGVATVTGVTTSD
ncbi:MAG: beta strand repeat-containing protein, partial [Isosphaeraceae bacterium]